MGMRTRSYFLVIVGLAGIYFCVRVCTSTEQTRSRVCARTSPLTCARANENREQDDDNSIGSEAFLSMHLGVLPKEDEKDLIVQNHAMMPHAPASGVWTGQIRALLFVNFSLHA